MLYVITPEREGHKVAKFGDRSEPEAVYHIRKRTCSCPASVSNCKHMQILKEWQAKKNARNLAYDDQKGRWIRTAPQTLSKYALDKFLKNLSK